jgi:hypothetical protein
MRLIIYCQCETNGNTVRFGINLRYDLKRRSDTDLAAELDRMLEYRQTRFGSSPPVGSAKGMIFYGAEWPLGRGPFHARLAYKIQIGYFLCFRGPRGTQYLVECEIQDLRDEIERRIKRRKTSPWAIR